MIICDYGIDFCHGTQWFLEIPMCSLYHRQLSASVYDYNQRPGRWGILLSHIVTEELLESKGLPLYANSNFCINIDNVTAQMVNRAVHLPVPPPSVDTFESHSTYHTKP